MSVPTFIVGTGRCGSTMLSNMLREHPHVLSLSEFFSALTDGNRSFEPFSSEPRDGAHFWSILGTTPPFFTFASRNGVKIPEYIYNCDAPDARFSSATGVPAILLTTLPHLTGNPDSLFDLLRRDVNSWATASLSEHYRHLFKSLADRFDKRTWVERSGGSVLYLAELLTTFSDARFIHVMRDGRDAAMSMQEHPGFRLGLALASLERLLGVDPLECEDRSHVDEVPTELLPFLPERFDLDAFRSFRAPLGRCSEFWTQQVVQALDLLGPLPPDRLLTLRYEDFFVDPKAQLDRLGAFLGEEFIDEDWSARCAATVRPPRSTWRDLPDETAQALTEACRKGFERLRAAGVHYDV